VIISPGLLDEDFTHALSLPVTCEEHRAAADLIKSMTKGSSVTAFEQSVALDIVR
jgi:hypothetical protein